MPNLVGLTPRLKTANLRRAMKFYAEVVWPKRRPTFCILERDGAQVGFSETGTSPAAPPELYFDVKDAAGWHRKLKRRV